MPHDLCLLFYTITFERKARPYRIIVSAERVAHQNQPVFTPLLRLPDMRHLVNEQALSTNRAMGEVIAI